MFNSVIKQGIQRIYNEDISSQKIFIENICKNIRHMKSDIIYKADAFFVPNDEYMVHYFGPEIRNISYDCYNEYGDCYWLCNLVFPLYNVIGDIVGLVGFNPINKFKSSESKEFWNLSSYRHSSKSVFEKSKYLFMVNGAYSKALSEGYIILTDGVFDMLSSAQEGLVSGALLGSYLSEEVIASLKFIDKVYISVDNDEAGLKLMKQLRRYLPHVRAIKQNKFKDLDDLLKSEYKDQFLRQFKNNLSSKYDLDLIFR